jgi:BirA family transcriptional regulator, biotin operon repressor / biotin---[acetyl-CoA-carboxylase] ligase
LPSLNPIGFPFTELLAIDSTNNYAMGLAREGMAQHGTTVFAHHQTRGKGQRDKEWLSAKGQNIAMSVLLEPQNLNPAQPFLLSMSVANATRQLCSNYALDGVKIKWPNDVYWRDRKAAGILIENVWQGSNWKFAVVGIGININQTDFGDLADRAVSLKQITGKEFAPVELAKDLCRVLQEHYQQMIERPDATIQEYKNHLYKINETVRLKKGNKIFDAVVKDVTLNGELIVQHDVEEKFDVGNVEWMISGE